MLVRIEAGQRFDPVRPDDGEQGENAAEGGEWLDQSNSGGRTIARLVGARLRVSSACDHVVTAALRRYRREPCQAVQCVTYRSTSARLDLGERVSSGRFHLRLAKPAHFDSPQLRSIMKVACDALDAPKLVATAHAKAAILSCVMFRLP
jgi:hypothetical protein